MATLDLEESDVDSEYSDGFLEDLSYSQSSSEEESTHELVARLESSLAKDRPRSTKDTSNSKHAGRGKDTSGLGKTLRMPVKLAKDSSVEKFNSSVDVRDACYSGWLSRKRSSISLDQSAKQKTVDEEKMKKKLKEVGVCVLSTNLLACTVRACSLYMYKFLLELLCGSNSQNIIYLFALSCRMRR